MKEREKEGPEFAKYLPAINNLLVEDPKLVADAITVRCQPQCGHGVQETGCKGQGDRLQEQSTGTLQGTSLLACCMCYSVLCMEMRSCRNSAAGNVYYSEQTHVQKGDKETVLLSNHKPPKLLVTRKGHQNPKSSFVAVRALVNLPCSKPVCPVKQSF